MSYVIDAFISAPSTRIINCKGEGILTPREEQIVNLVADGIGNREIAEQLSIKENTVKKSLLRTYDKIGVSNRVELVLYTFAHRGPEKRAGSPSIPKKAAASALRDAVNITQNQSPLLVAGSRCNP